MPFYEYERTEPDGSTKRIVLMQSIHDSACNTCPYTGRPCRRVMSRFHQNGIAAEHEENRAEGKRWNQWNDKRRRTEDAKGRAESA